MESTSCNFRLRETTLLVGAKSPPSHSPESGFRIPCCVFVLEPVPSALTVPLDIMELKTLKGLALHDILTEIHLFVHRGNSLSSLVEMGEEASGVKGGREGT